MKKEKDILSEICGVDDNGVAKAMVEVTTRIVDLESGEEKLVSRETLKSTVVNCFRSVRHMTLDLLFESGTDPDFVDTVKMLRKFTVPENSLDGSKYPVITVTAMPTSLFGEYYATGINGSWVITPSQFNKPADTIRFIFDNSDFHCYRVTDNEDEQQPQVG